MLCNHSFSCFTPRMGVHVCLQAAQGSEAADTPCEIWRIRESPHRSGGTQAAAAEGRNRPQPRSPSFPGVPAESSPLARRLIQKQTRGSVTDCPQPAILLRYTSGRELRQPAAGVFTRPHRNKRNPAHVIFSGADT
jgi:hypothetical protein